VTTVEVDGLVKRFGRVTAVDGLRFGASAGEITGFLGPNGAGKSTTLRMLLGLLRPDAGRATVLGRPYRRLAEPARVVGAVLDAAAFHPGRSARDHLRVSATAAGIPERRVDEVLALVGLTDVAGRRAGGFSMGMRQRLALAAALLGDPQVLVLDEPANGLDPEGIRWLRDFLRYLAGQGRTVLVSSHVLAEVARTADRVVILNRGRLVADSPLSELAARFAATTTVRSPQADRLRTLLEASGATVSPAGGGDTDALDVDGLTAEAVGELAAAHGIALHHLAPGTTLEDMFLRLVAEAER